LGWTIEQARGLGQTEKQGRRVELRVINSARSF
jgi:hypothetical protein